MRGARSVRGPRRVLHLHLGHHRLLHAALGRLPARDVLGRAHRQLRRQRPGGHPGGPRTPRRDATARPHRGGARQPHRAAGRGARGARPAHVRPVLGRVPPGAPARGAVPRGPGDPLGVGARPGCGPARAGAAGADVLPRGGPGRAVRAGELQRLCLRRQSRGGGVLRPDGGHRAGRVPARLVRARAAARDRPGHQRPPRHAADGGPAGDVRLPGTFLRHPRHLPRAGRHRGRRPRGRGPGPDVLRRGREPGPGGGAGRRAVRDRHRRRQPAGAHRAGGAAAAGHGRRLLAGRGAARPPAGVRHSRDGGACRVPPRRAGRSAAGAAGAARHVPCGFGASGVGRRARGPGGVRGRGDGGGLRGDRRGPDDAGAAGPRPGRRPG